MALRYADAITWNPDLADATMWRQLHTYFTEPELVEIGQCVAMHAGEQRWIYTLHIRHGEYLATTEAGLSDRAVAEMEQIRSGQKEGAS